MEINNAPKMFGQVGLGTERLKADVKEAKQQLQSLAKEAAKLGEIFDKLGVANNLGAIKNSLENTRKNIKQVTDDIARQFEESAKKAAEAKSKVVEAISHNYSFGHISPEEAHDELVKYIEQRREEMNKALRSDRSRKALATQNGQEFVPTDLSGFTSEIVKAEALLKRVWDDWQQIQRANAELEQKQAAERERVLREEQTIRSKLEKMREDDAKRQEAQFQAVNDRRLKEYSQNMKAMIDLDKARYRQGEIDFIQYLAKLKMYEQQAAVLNFSDKEMNVFAKERMRVNNDLTKNQAQLDAANRLQFEREYERQSKEIVDNLIQMRKAGYIQDLDAHKQMLNQMLQNETIFTRNDLRRLQQEVTLIEKKSQDERIQAVKQYNNEVLKVKDSINSTFGTAEQRFKSLTNYAFDASVIYGSIQGLKEMAQSVKDIDSASTNLSRVIPQLSPDESLNKTMKTDMVNDLRQQAFEVGKLTGTQVADVQKIQNLWARASDSIAKSKDAMEELTRVTAMGLQTGGFDDAEQAVNLLNATLNQLGLNWTEAEHVMSSWVKVADTTAVGSAKDLAEVISRVGTQAKNMGLTYHDLNAMTAVFANNMSRSGEEIGTAMKTVLSYFEDPNTIKVLEKYGVEVKKNAKEFNNFNDIMRQLGDAFQRLKLDNNTRAIAELSNALGRIRRRDYVGILLEHWNETRDVVQDSLNSLNKAGSYLQQQSEALSDTYEHKINSLKVAFQEFAWSVGESGLLDDLKSFVTGVSSAVQWFSNLDPVMKNGILTILEIGAALTVASKGIQLLTGSGLVQFLANATAKLAILTQSQALLNASVAAGQNIYAVNTEAITVNTAAKSANAAAQEAVNIVDSQGNVIMSTQAGITAENTADMAANTVATEANTAAQLTLNNAKQVGAATSGLLGGAVAALANPINLIIGLLGAAATAFVMYKQKQEEARKETEAFKSAHESLQLVLSQKVVEDTYIPELQKKADQMNEARKKYEEAAKGLAEANKTMNDLMQSGNAVVALPYGGVANSPQFDMAAKSAENYKKAMNEAEQALKNMGTSTNTVADDLAKLNSLIVTSSDATTRKAYAVIDVIEKDHKFNDTMRDQVNRYQELIAITNRTTDQELELKSITNSLSTVFPQYAGRINHVTQQREFDVEAIKKQIGVSGQLTDAQLEEIKTTVQLDEATKQAALNIIQSEIEQTKAKKANTEARINMMKSEMQAMSSFLKASGITIPNFLPNKGVTQDQIYRLKASGDIPMMIADDKVYDFLNANGKLGLLGGTDQDYKDVAALDAQLQKLEGTLKAVQGIKPFDPADWAGTPLADDEKTKKKKTPKSPAEQASTYLDFQSDKLEIIDSQINVLKSELDAIDDTEENRKERLEKITEIRDKENQKIGVLNDLTDENEKALGQVNAKMEKYIAGWTNMDGDQKLEALNKLSDESKSKVSGLTSEYQKLKEKMRSNQEQIASTRAEIKRLNDEINKINIQIIADAYTNKVARSSAVAKYQMDQIDRSISKIKSSIDEIDEKSDNASARRLELDSQLLDKENEKIKGLIVNHKVYNDLLWEVNYYLDKQIQGWQDMNGAEKIAAINSLTAQQKQILQPLLDQWQKLSDLMSETESNLDAANSANLEFERDMESQVEAEYRKGLELEKQIAYRRLLAKQEKEQADLERAIFGMTQKQWELNTAAAINAKQKQIDQLKEQIDLQEYLNELNDIDAEIEKVKNDTRFAYIDEATGKEIMTYDRARVAELEKERQDKVQKKTNDDRINALENELKAMQDAAEEKRKLYQDQLENLQKYQQNEMDSFNQYWTDRMDDEKVHQEALEMIRGKGYSKALSGVKKFNEDLKKTYDSYNKPLYDTGVSLTQSLMNGMSSYIDQYIAQKNAEMYALGQSVRASFLAGMNGGTMPAPPTVSKPVVTTPSFPSSSTSIASIVSQMKANSAKWFTASPQERARLEAENLRLASLIGARKDANGDWIYPTYHIGGFVGGKALDPAHEELAKLLKGEFVLTPEMMTRLSAALTIPNVGVSFPSVTQMQTTYSNGKTVSVYINTINANNFEELMRSLDPYIDSHK